MWSEQKNSRRLKPESKNYGLSDGKEDVSDY